MKEGLVAAPRATLAVWRVFEDSIETDLKFEEQEKYNLKDVFLKEAEKKEKKKREMHWYIKRLRSTKFTWEL